MKQVPTASILGLLQEKNSLLDSFLTLTSEELRKIKKKKFDSLERFYQHRGKILNLIRVISEHCEAEFANAAVCPVEKAQADQMVAECDNLIARILKLDLEMIALIDHEKNLVIRELQSVSSNRKVLKAYRSGL